MAWSFSIHRALHCNLQPVLLEARLGSDLNSPVLHERLQSKVQLIVCATFNHAKNFVSGRSGFFVCLSAAHGSLSILSQATNELRTPCTCARARQIPIASKFSCMNWRQSTVGQLELFNTHCSFAGGGCRHSFTII